MSDKSVSASEQHNKNMEAIANEYASGRLSVLEAGKQQGAEIHRFREEVKAIEQVIYPESRRQMESALESKVVRR